MGVRLLITFHSVTRVALLCAATGLSSACGRADPDVHADIRAQLAADPVTAPLELSITVNRGVVHLAGETTSDEERQQALAVARSVEGVNRVVNNMTLRVPGLADAVKRALAADPMVGNIPIEVEAEDGLVRLRSDATNREERERAVEIASQVEGVTNVEDWMK